MSWVIVGLGVGGAAIGGLTNKKHPLKGALIGAGIGATAGLGAGALGVGAAGAASPLAAQTAAFGGGTSAAGMGAGANAMAAGVSTASPLASTAASPSMLSSMMTGAKSLQGNALVQQAESGMMSKAMGGGDSFHAASEFNPNMSSGDMGSAPAVQMSSPLSMSNLDPEQLAMLRKRMQGGY